MPEPAFAILLADPDARTRAYVAEQLAPLGCDVFQAADGDTALRILKEREIRIVVSELCLPAGGERCLIAAIRRTKELRRTRAIALTARRTSDDRDWAMTAGAEAYLLKPTRGERLRHVVTRLATPRRNNTQTLPPADAAIGRRDSLEAALGELEHGTLSGTSSIVFARTWWQDLTRSQQTSFRKRARQVGVRLRSDSLLTRHYVEVRGTRNEAQGLSSERPESPYRGESL